MTSSTSILCLGASHFDRTMQCLEPYLPAASNPVKTLHRMQGGVARNIAVHMRLQGCNVGLCGGLGHDGDGEQLLKSLAEIGIDTRQIAQIDGEHTASYTAVLDQTGELALGLMDAEIYDLLTPEFLAPRLPHLRNWQWWLVDANFPRETLEWLCENSGDIPVCAATVSPSKGARFKSLLGKLDLIITNRMESQILTDMTVETPQDAVKAVEKLRRQGAQMAIVTLGSQGVVCANEDGVSFWRPLPTRLRDVNGAGDAFYSGFMTAFSQNQDDFDGAIRRGLAMASLTAEVHGTTVWNLDLAEVEKRALTAHKEW